MTNQILQSVIEDPSATITQIEQPLTHESIGLRETDFAMFVCESPAIYFPGKQIYKDLWQIVGGGFCPKFIYRQQVEVQSKAGIPTRNI